MFLIVKKMETEKIMPEINTRKCSGCGKCVDKCPNNVLVLTPTKRNYWHQKSKVLVANPQNCVACNACVVSCPHHAISLWRYNLPAPDLCSEEIEQK